MERRSGSSSVHVIAVLVLAALLAGAIAGRASGDQYLLLVDPDDADEVIARYGLELEDELDSKDLLRVSDPDGRGLQELQALTAGDSKVLGLELDGAHVLGEVPGLNSDQSSAAILETARRSTPVPYYGAWVPSAYAQQPAATLIGVPAAHVTGAGQITVAVIDTGVDPAHPALRGALVPGYDFTRDVAGTASELLDLDPSAAALFESSAAILNDDQSSAAILEGRSVAILNESTAAILHDDQSSAAILESPLPAAFGHGTMVAGLVHLVAPTARIMPLKAFRGDGSARLYDIVRAIYFATDNGARVINMSFSMPSRSDALHRALGYAHDRGVLLVAAVGNGGTAAAVYPASSSKVVGVASTSNGDKRSRFSNYGTAIVSVAAPGEALITTYPGSQYAAAWGTSFSAGLASGSAALLVRDVPAAAASADADKAESALEHARRLTKELGKGRVDLPSALEALTEPED